MGWTSTDARFYTADGKVNRKAECDALYTWEGEKTKNEVIKSSMRGSVYYAAVRTTDKTTGHSEVFAAVCLTSTRQDGGFNFGYKGMAEDMGPCEDDCPKGILVLLTDTESKYAKEWRERCWAKIRDKKQNRQSLASIKIGEIIEFERGGVTIRAEKMAPAYQFKTPWFKVVGEFEYVHKTEIKDWRIVADNPATPTETPQIVRVEIVRDFDNTYYANLYDENGGSHNLSKEYTDFRTLKTLCKKEYGVNLPNLSQIEFEGHGRKSYAYISAETPQISTEAPEVENESTESNTAPQETVNEQTREYIITTYKTKENLTAKFSAAIGSIVMQLDKYRANPRKGGRYRREKIQQLEDSARGMYEQLQEWSVLFDAPQPPQSPKVEQRVTRRAYAPPKATKSGMVFYAMPHRRERVPASPCHVADVRKMAPYPDIAPPGYAPPIRGDCVCKIIPNFT